MLKLPSAAHSIWREAYNKPIYAPLKGDHDVDVVIVGAGITGLTAAYLLKKSGKQVIVLDKDTVGGGTTGRNTAKLTSQHGMTYAKLQKQHGKKTAQLYGQAAEAALGTISKIVESEKIDCDWQPADHYVFTTDSKQVKKLKEEAEVAESIGLPASFCDDAPLPFPVEAAVKFSRQAKFHPQKYVIGLARIIHGDGSSVHEASRVRSIKDGDVGHVFTANGMVYAKHIIVATNVPTLPLIARGTYCLFEYPTESYVVAGKPTVPVSEMFISPDSDNYSIMPINIGAEKYILIGGEGHISGLRGSTEKRFQRLANYAHKHFGVTEITHKWSDRDYMAYDDLPLVGKAYHWSKNLYVATAFRKWGLTNGTAAAMLLHDIILQRYNPWGEVYNSLRLTPIKYIPKVAAQHIMPK